MSKALLSPEQVEHSAPAVVRIVARALLHRAARAHRKFARADNPEGLHDVRVALRRLYSWLRAFEPVLADTVRRRTTRRLRVLTRMTNRARDLEVEVAWLDDRRRRSAGVPRGSASRRRKAALERSRAAVGVALARDLPRLSRKLDRQLSHYSLDVQLDGAGADIQPFGVLAADVLVYRAGRLRRALSRIRGADDEQRAHRARIAEKHLRYVVEPLASVLPGARALLQRLSILQEDLGELHDAQVLVAELTGQGEAVVAARRRVRRAYARFDENWSGSSAEGLLEAVEAAAARLHGVRHVRDR